MLDTAFLAESPERIHGAKVARKPFLQKFKRKPRYRRYWHGDRKLIVVTIPNLLNGWPHVLRLDYDFAIAAEAKPYFAKFGTGL